MFKVYLKCSVVLTTRPVDAMKPPSVLAQELHLPSRLSPSHAISGEFAVRLHHSGHRASHFADPLQYQHPPPLPTAVHSILPRNTHSAVASGVGGPSWERGGGRCARFLFVLLAPPLRWSARPPAMCDHEAHIHPSTFLAVQLTAGARSLNRVDGRVEKTTTFIDAPIRCTNVNHENKFSTVGQQSWYSTRIHECADKHTSYYLSTGTSG